MFGVPASVACQYDEFFCAVAIWIGVMVLPPTTGLKCSSHSSLNSPMLRWTRFSAPSRPTESAPSFSTWGVRTVASGLLKNSVSGPLVMKSLNCLLSSSPPASFSCHKRLAVPMRAVKSYTAFMVRGLLMLSVEMSEVSIAPGRNVWASWNI